MVPATNVSAPPYCFQTSRRLVSACKGFLSTSYTFSELEQKYTRWILRFHDFAGWPWYTERRPNQCWQRLGTTEIPRKVENVSSRLLAPYVVFWHGFQNFWSGASCWVASMLQTQQNNRLYSVLETIRAVARMRLHFRSWRFSWFPTTLERLVRDSWNSEEFPVVGFWARCSSSSKDIAILRISRLNIGLATARSIRCGIWFPPFSMARKTKWKC